MTRATEIANILKKLGDAHYQAADELLALASNEPAQSAPAPRPEAADSLPAAPAFDSAEFGDPVDFQEGLAAVMPVEPEGAEVVCPKHRRPYKEGKFGLFCTSTSDDPAWSNKRGYCSITPKNAATYLRVKAAA